MLDNPGPWQRSQTVADWVRPYMLELSYTSRRLKPYAEELGDDGAPFRWDPERHALLRADLDATNEVIGYRPADPSLSSKTIGVVDTIALAQCDEDGILIGRPGSGCGRGCESWPHSTGITGDPADSAKSLESAMACAVCGAEARHPLSGA